MAPKKSLTSVPDTSSSGTASVGLAFLSGEGVKDFATMFHLHPGLLRLRGSLLAVSSPKYLDWKSDQLWNYEVHLVQAPVPACHKGGLDWSNWNKMLPRFFQKTDVSSVELHWADWVKRMEPRYRACWLDNGIYHAITCSTVQL
ncbi:hypothetical protein Pyn_03646 [Prunus yedoensis var. nudiflora]|uniref:Uncharacterized protein n=1 Tax=Prunus yedoensis var. nudiflora TaxID=2094558 RepID=A0A314ZP04_PRUYE|nr:hypothetical protein Pyn_03646 [Prunus yedoensis var. nudiflora]